jgi:hypothetical protein
LFFASRIMRGQVWREQQHGRPATTVRAEARR